MNKISAKEKQKSERARGPGGRRRIGSLVGSRSSFFLLSVCLSVWRRRRLCVKDQARKTRTNAEPPGRKKKKQRTDDRKTSTNTQRWLISWNRTRGTRAQEPAGPSTPYKLIPLLTSLLISRFGQLKQKNNQKKKKSSTDY